VSTPTLRSFSPALRWFFLATVVNTSGSAALFGFALIYFHEIRGIPLSQAGLAVAASSFAIVACTPYAGSLSDRFGARRILVMGCLLSIVAGSLYGFVTSFAQAFAVSALLGVANAMWFPSQAALLALMVPQSERPTVSAFQRASLNLGAALGGVVGGFVVHGETLTAFRVLFAINVATSVLFLAVLPGMPRGKVEYEPHHDGAGMRDVLRDGFFVRLLVTDVAIALGFGFLFAFMPAYASELGISKATIGVLFGLGAVSVVTTQIPTLRWASGRPRMRSLAIMNCWFVVAFGLMLLTSHVTVGLAVLLIAVGQVVGGFGESVLGAVRQPLTSDLAPAHLVGRYFGLAAMVFQGCMGLASILGGLAMSRSVHLVWWIPFVASVCGVGGSLALRRRIPRHLVVSA
jgi:MFS family permease